jgi:cysteinyl-tRNA synthetase
MQLYNTLTRDKKNITGELGNTKTIKLFVCGPTVYGDAHIGHARTYIFFDFLTKYLRSQGYDVFYLQNITDIDDKIIKRAAETGVSPGELAAKFAQSYFEDMKSLGVDGVTEYAPATQFIPEIIAQVERLIEKGFAYAIDGDGWYFDIAKDTDYGKLSGRTAAQAEDGVSRIDDAALKRNKGDFCLWKFSKPGEPTWPGESLGSGRPGWHIEDTAISEKFFGPQYDIHGGAIDLKFPHHEAEIAQQESASGKKPFVKIWVHTGFLTVNGEKMSKSLGNFITIKDFLKKYPAEVLRWMTFTHHYRAPLDYSDDSAEQAKSALERIRMFLAKLESRLTSEGFKEKSVVFDDYDYSKFDDLIADDLDTPGALGFFFRALGDANETFFQLDKNSLERAIDFIKKVLGFFGIRSDSPEIPQEIRAKAAERELSRGNKDFAQSDALRKEIEALGYVIEDTPHGPFIWPKT